MVIFIIMNLKTLLHTAYRWRQRKGKSGSMMGKLEGRVNAHFSRLQFLKPIGLSENGPLLARIERREHLMSNLCGLLNYLFKCSSIHSPSAAIFVCGRASAVFTRLKLLQLFVVTVVARIFVFK